MSRLERAALFLLILGLVGSCSTPESNNETIASAAATGDASSTVAVASESTPATMPRALQDWLQKNNQGVNFPAEVVKVVKRGDIWEGTVTMLLFNGRILCGDVLESDPPKCGGGIRLETPRPAGPTLLEMVTIRGSVDPNTMVFVESE